MAGCSYGKRYSTPLNPSRAAAAKRSRNGCSPYIIVRLAARLGMSPARAERAAQLLDLRLGERLRARAHQHPQLRRLPELLEDGHRVGGRLVADVRAQA